MHRRNGITLATYEVINTDDAGAGSLRQAIIDANANAQVPHRFNRDAASWPMANGNRLSVISNYYLHIHKKRRKNYTHI